MRIRNAATRNVNEEVEDKRTTVMRVADWIADFSGSLPFLFMHLGFFAMWIGWNVVVPSKSFDAYPFGFLTLVVSLEAIILSVFVLLSQNRQVERERVRSDIEYDVNIKAELQIAHMHEKVDGLYSAITKTVGGWRQYRIGTLKLGLGKLVAIGSVPAAILGVQIVSELQKRLGEDKLDSLVYAVLGGTLLMVGVITLLRAFILAKTISERDDFVIERRHKVAAVIIGATTGFVIGVTSAGSGTVIAVLLIAVYRLTPKHVVGTDVFHAAVVLWAAGLAHFGHGNVDLGLVGNILIGSVPGVVIGAALTEKVPQDKLRVALGLVLFASGIATIQKGDPLVWPIAAAVAGIGFTLILMAPRWFAKYRPKPDAGPDTS